MSELATEIVYLPLKPNLDLDTNATWAKTLTTIAQQPGVKAAYWGRQIENPDTVQMAIDWESISAHQTFMSSPAYQPFLDKLDEDILNGAPTVFHIQLPQPPASDAENPLHAPVTECISAYLAPEYSQSQYGEQFASFKDEASKVPNVEATGLMGGWSVEDHKFQEDGEEGKMFAAFIGWPSVDAHMNFRKTEEFKSVIGYARDGTRGLKVWHVEFKQFK